MAGCGILTNPFVVCSESVFCNWLGVTCFTNYYLCCALRKCVMFNWLWHPHKFSSLFISFSGSVFCIWLSMVITNVHLLSLCLQKVHSIVGWVWHAHLPSSSFTVSSGSTFYSWLGLACSLTIISFHCVLRKYVQ